MICAGLAGVVSTFKFKDSLDSSMMMYGGVLVFFMLFVFGVIWWNKYSSASNLFYGAPRDCTLHSTDTDVFYARK